MVLIAVSHCEVVPFSFFSAGSCCFKIYTLSVLDRDLEKVNYIICLLSVHFNGNKFLLYKLHFFKESPSLNTVYPT